MQVANKTTKRHQVGDGLNRKGGFGGLGDVVKQLNGAGQDQHQAQEHCHSPGSQGVAPACLGGRDGGRVQVVKERRAHVLNYILEWAS